MSDPYTFAQLKQDLRDRVWPEGEADNLIESHNQTIIDGLIDLQQAVDCLRLNNTLIVPACATYFQCGTTVFEAPRGRINKLWVISKTDENGKEDADGEDNYCSLIHYHRVEYCDLEAYRSQAFEAQCNGLLPSLASWFNLPGCCHKGAFPQPTDEGIADPTVLPMGYHLAQASTDHSCGRAEVGVWALRRGRIHIQPWLQSYETVVIEWEGLKRDWEDLDLVDNDPMLRKALQNYLRWKDAIEFEDNPSRAQSFEVAYYNDRSDLMYECREEVKQRSPCEPSHARQSDLTLYEQGVSTTSTTTTTTGTTTATSTTTGTTGTTTATSSTTTTAAASFDFCVTAFSIVGYSGADVVGEWGDFEENSGTTFTGAPAACDLKWSITIDFGTGGRLDSIEIFNTDESGNKGTESWSTEDETKFPLAIYEDPFAIPGNLISNAYVASPFDNTNNLGTYVGVVTFIAYGQMRVPPREGSQYLLEVNASEVVGGDGSGAATGQVDVYEPETEFRTCSADSDFDGNVAIRMRCDPLDAGQIAFAVGTAAWAAVENMGNPIDESWLNIDIGQLWDGDVTCDDASLFDVNGYWWKTYELVCPVGSGDGRDTADKCESLFLYWSVDGGAMETFGPFAGRPGTIIDFNNGDPQVISSGLPCNPCSDDPDALTPVSLPGAPRCLSEMP